MKKIAIKHAHARLNRAKEALIRLRHAESFEGDVEPAWSDFLTSCAGIYEKLDIGSKSNGRSAAWFGRKVNERRTDPLLRYLHHARNVDFHGLQEMGEWDVGTVGAIDPLEFGAEPTRRDHKWVGPTPEEGGGEIWTIYPETAWLVTVVDERFGDRFDPPMEHMGEKLEALTAYRAAQAVIPYLEGMIREAEALSDGP